MRLGPPSAPSAATSANTRARADRAWSQRRKDVGDTVEAIFVYELSIPFGETHAYFDRCSRKNVVANDIFYVGVLGLPGIFDDLASNKARLDAIEAYKCRKMRYVFHSTGPDFFSRYLKRTKLDNYVVAISERTFLDRREQHRNASVELPKTRVVHHLSWVPQLSPQNAM